MDSDELVLKIYEDRSEYTSDGKSETFIEGATSSEAKARAKSVKDAFAKGFLDNVIGELKNGAEIDGIETIDEGVQQNLSRLVDSITSEKGRALVALTVMQLSIKAVSPDQNIRLHKGGGGSSSFSWVDGISMRTLDKAFVTPVLRKHNLLRLNADGFMMTRSLAENYPYTKLYKAKLRGALSDWLAIVESLERAEIDPTKALRYLVSLLLNKASDFEEAASTMLQRLENYCAANPDKEQIGSLIRRHIEDSDYAARLMEVAMHSLMQAAIETGALGLLELKPLSQMRSANKKHGNIGDIELLSDSEIVESWDAKYGKNYLRDEIDEVLEKLENHERIETVGFVITGDLLRQEEISLKIADVEELYGIRVAIRPFEQWIADVYSRVLETQLADENDLAVKWLFAYAESLAQKRREVAPIDEPCFTWVTTLSQLLTI